MTSFLFVRVCIPSHLQNLFLLITYLSFLVMVSNRFHVQDLPHTHPHTRSGTLPVPSESAQESNL